MRSRAPRARQHRHDDRRRGSGAALSCRSRRFARAPRSPTLAGWEGLGPRRAGVPEARAAVVGWRERAARATPATRIPGAPRSRARTGTPKSSARRCRASPAIRCSRARRTPTFRTSPAPRAMLEARRSRYIRCSRRTTRTRSPGSSSAARKRAASTNSSSSGLHGMGECALPRR